MRHNYAAIGGRSPLTDITLAQAAALRARLGPACRSPSACATGGRSSRTRWRSSRRRASRASIGIPMAPQFSTLSVAEVHRCRRRRAAAGRAVRRRSSRSTRIRCCSTRSPSASRAAQPQRRRAGRLHRAQPAGARHRRGRSLRRRSRPRPRAASPSARASRGTSAPTRAPAARRSRGSARDSSELIDDRVGDGAASFSSSRSASSATTPRSCSTSTSRRRAPRASSARRCGAPSR